MKFTIEGNCCEDVISHPFNVNNNNKSQPESVLPVGPSVCFFFNSIRFCQSKQYLTISSELNVTQLKLTVRSTGCTVSFGVGPSFGPSLDLAGFLGNNLNIEYRILYGK